MHFPCVGNGVGGRAVPDSLKTEGFQCISMLSAVGWAALVAQESLKIYSSPYTMISVHLHGFSGGVGGLAAQETLKINGFHAFHCLGNGVWGAGGP